MKISISALLLVLGASDAFTGPSPSNPALTSLQASRHMTGGIEGSQIFEDRGQVDRDAAWGTNPVHQWDNSNPSVRPAQPTNPAFRPAGRAGFTPFSMTGGIGGSALMDDRIDPDSAFSSAYYKMHAPGVFPEQQEAPPPQQPAPVETTAPFAQAVPQNTAIPNPAVQAAPVAKVVGDPNPTFPQVPAS